MSLAVSASKRGTCSRLQVGAVLVNNNRVKATGYNGSKPHSQHCCDVGCDLVNGHCVRTVHAEINCLNDATVEEKAGGVLYVTHFPCECCQKVIAESGIKEVVYLNNYHNKLKYDIKVRKI